MRLSNFRALQNRLAVMGYCAFQVWADGNCGLWALHALESGTPNVHPTQQDQEKLRARLAESWLDASHMAAWRSIFATLVDTFDQPQAVMIDLSTPPSTPPRKTPLPMLDVDASTPVHAVKTVGVGRGVFRRENPVPNPAVCQAWTEAQALLDLKPQEEDQLIVDDAPEPVAPKRRTRACKRKILSQEEQALLETKKYLAELLITWLFVQNVHARPHVQGM